jgi:hypothetical protein
MRRFEKWIAIQQCKSTRFEYSFIVCSFWCNEGYKNGSHIILFTALKIIISKLSKWKFEFHYNLALL